MKKPTWTRLSVLTLVIGIALLVMMVTVEDEPGALPLFLILAGAGGHLWAKLRSGSFPTFIF